VVGDNAIHKLADVLSVLADYEPATIEVEGLAYREGLNAIRRSTNSSSWPGNSSRQCCWACSRVLSGAKR
jgi:hypothetical protein